MIWARPVIGASYSVRKVPCVALIFPPPFINGLIINAEIKVSQLVADDLSTLSVVAFFQTTAHFNHCIACLNLCFILVCYIKYRDQLLWLLVGKSSVY